MVTSIFYCTHVFRKALPLVVAEVFNLFPQKKILDQTKLKAFADDEVGVTKIIISVFDRVENIVGRKKLLVQAISPFPTMFSKGFLNF